MFYVHFYFLYFIILNRNFSFFPVDQPNNFPSGNVGNACNQYMMLYPPLIAEIGNVCATILLIESNVIITGTIVLFPKRLNSICSVSLSYFFKVLICDF